MLKPIRNSDWNPSLAAHLLNRTGFGASPTAIEEFAEMKPGEAVTRIVHYESIVDEVEPPLWARGPDADRRPDFKRVKDLSEEERRMFQRENRRTQLEQLLDLRMWWLERMRTTTSPLEEKLTLFWHGHFATSAQKVRSAYALYLQNQTFRTHASGNWRDLIVAVSQDPAMLFYLDNAKSRRGHPNENYARELMELFTLGEGNYTEEDIQAAARAFTGWSLDKERIAFVDRERAHDSGKKTFMKKTGHLDGYDIIDAILEHPACPEYISSKLWRFFAYEDVEPEMAQELGSILKGSDYEFQPLLERMFMSREFYSTKSAYSQIKSPVQWLVGTSIILEDQLPRAEVCSMIMQTLGQELFLPPNVKGWNGGYAWITTASLIQRYNLSGFLVKGSGDMLGKKYAARQKEKMEEHMDTMPPMARVNRSIGTMDPVDTLERVLPEANRTSLDAAWSYLEWRMYQRRLNDSQKAVIMEYLSNQSAPSEWDDDTLREILHVMMSTPYYQVC